MQTLSTSAGWVAVILNLLPGLGTGYIYQRRWKAYWTTTLISMIWVCVGFFRDMSLDLNDPVLNNNDKIGLYGFIIIALVTSIESGLAVLKARDEVGNT